MDTVEAEPIRTNGTQNDGGLAIRSNLGFTDRDMFNQYLARAVLASKAFEISHHLHAMMYQQAVQVQMQQMQPIMGNSRMNFALPSPFLPHGVAAAAAPAPFMHRMHPAFVSAPQAAASRPAPPSIMPPPLQQSQQGGNMSLELEEVDHSYNPNPNDYNVLYNMMQPFCQMFGCEENRRPHIVEFIFNQLKDSQNSNVIQWTGLDGSFKVNNPQELAHRWGMTKGSKNMTYEKMSRSIRNYYRRGTISKIRHHYCYRINMNELGASSDNSWIRNYFQNRRAAEIARQSSPPASGSDQESGGVIEELSN